MEKRVTEKIVKLQDREFKIKRFDAFTGSYILFQILEKVLPLALENQVKVKTDSGKEQALASMLPKDRVPMTKQEFTGLMRDCLSVVAEVLPAGEIPVFNPNGSWRLNDISQNTALAMGLVIHSLVFNVGDFFAGAGLQELSKNLLGSLPANTKI